MTEDVRVIEFGKEPKEGMVLVGFSGECIIEGREMKEKIAKMFKEGDVGFRKAVQYVQEDGMACLNDALDVVSRMLDEYKKNGISGLFKKDYKYELNRIFWCYEEDLPQEDPRYFKMNYIDMRDYSDKDIKSLNFSEIINKNKISPNYIYKKPNIESKIIFDTSKDKTGDNIDNEWRR